MLSPHVSRPLLQLPLQLPNQPARLVVNSDSTAEHCTNLITPKVSCFIVSAGDCRECFSPRRNELHRGTSGVSRNKTELIER